MVLKERGSRGSIEGVESRLVQEAGDSTEKTRCVSSGDLEWHDSHLCFCYDDIDTHTLNNSL